MSSLGMAAQLMGTKVRCRREDHTQGERRGGQPMELLSRSRQPLEGGGAVLVHHLDGRKTLGVEIAAPRTWSRRSSTSPLEEVVVLAVGAEK
jgi:hypothetical protein